MRRITVKEGITNYDDFTYLKNMVNGIMITPRGANIMRNGITVGIEGNVSAFDEAKTEEDSFKEGLFVLERIALCNDIPDLVDLTQIVSWIISKKEK